MSCFFDTDKNDCRRECCGCILTETLLVRGSMGPAGPTGAQGPAGQRGPTGPTGATEQVT